MFTKFYWSLWTVLALVTVGLFASGNLGWFGITVIGFTSCLFIFMGMMCLTPTLVGPHAKEFQHSDAEPLTPEPRAKKERKPIAAGILHKHA